MNNKLDPKPAIAPIHVLFGLTRGKIFLLPNFTPNPKAAVSHIQTDKKSAKVILKPATISEIFRNDEREPNIIPNHKNENSMVLIFKKGVCFFLNISIAITVRVKPINKL